MSFPKDIQIFVAMPYTEKGFGTKAIRRKPIDIEKLYKRFAEELAQRSGKEVKLLIERENLSSGTVHGSMFKSIYEADIVIADITGARANVYYELGIRFGLCRGLTLITSQDETTPFDVAPMRIIKYARRLDEDFMEDMIGAVETWMQNPTDRRSSPMVEFLDLTVVPRTEWERVSGSRIKDMLAAAKQAKAKAERVELTRRAVAEDTWSASARVELVKALRLMQDYDAAVQSAIESIAWFPSNAALHRELGIAQDRLSESRWAENERALQSLGRALELNPDDVDARCCRGGALRRRALRDRERRKSDLEASLADYERALEKGRHNTYAGLNIVRLHFLMQPFRNDAGEIRNLHLRRMYHLCEFEVADALRTKASESWWSHFDLGDALVMHGRPDDGIGSYDSGIRLIPEAERRDVLLSPLRAWKELISADTLDGPVLRGAEEVSKLLDRSSG